MWISFYNVNSICVQKRDFNCNSWSTTTTVEFDNKRRKLLILSRPFDGSGEGPPPRPREHEQETTWHVAHGVGAARYTRFEWLVLAFGS